MDNKEKTIYALVMANVILLVALLGVAFLRQPEVKVVEKKVYYAKPYKIEDIRDRLLAQGVESAWVGNLAGVKSDCFSTAILDDHQSIFSYCKLRKKLLMPNE